MFSPLSSCRRSLQAIKEDREKQEKSSLFINTPLFI
jgi:hypothetical protein